MSRSGIASPGGYVNYTPTAMIEDSLESARASAERANRLIEACRSHATANRAAGAAVQIHNALRAIGRSIEHMKDAARIQLDRHPELPGEFDTPKIDGPSSSRLPAHLPGLLSRAATNSRTCELKIARLHGDQCAASNEPTNNNALNLRLRIDARTAELIEIRKILGLAKGRLMSTPGAVHALRFRRNYQSPLPMYLRALG